MFVAYVALLTAQFIGSANAILARLAFTESVGEGFEQLDSLTMAVFRTVVAFLNFAIIRYVFWNYYYHPISSSVQQQQQDDVGDQQQQQQEKQRRVSAIDALRCIFLGSFGIGANMMLYLGAIQLSSATAVAGMLSLTPGVTFIVNYFMGEEPFSYKKLGGLVLVTAGNILLNKVYQLLMPSSEPQQQQQHRGVFFYVGLLLVFCNVLCFVFFITLQRSKAFGASLVHRLHYTHFMFYVYTGAVGFLILATLCIPSNVVSRQLFGWMWGGPRLTTTAWVACCWGGGLQATFSYFFISFSLRFLSSLVIALFNNLTPLLICVMAFVFLHEEMGRVQVVGGLLIIVGLTLSIVAVRETMALAEEQEKKKQEQEQKQQQQQQQQQKREAGDQVRGGSDVSVPPSPPIAGVSGAVAVVPLEEVKA